MGRLRAGTDPDRRDDFTDRDILIDKTTRFLPTIGGEQSRINEGDHYYMEGFATLALNANMYVKLSTPDTTHWSHFTWDIGSSLGLETYLYRGATGGMTGGTTVTALNSNHNYSNSSDIAIMSGTSAPTTNGITVSQAAWGARQAGGDQSRASKLVFAQNTVYCRRFISKANDNVVSFAVRFYGHTDLK